MSRPKVKYDDSDAKLDGGLAWLAAIVRSRRKTGIRGTSSRVMLLVEFDGCGAKKVTMSDVTEVHECQVDPPPDPD